MRPNSSRDTATLAIRKTRSLLTVAATCKQREGGVLSAAVVPRTTTAAMAPSTTRTVSTQHDGDYVGADAEDHGAEQDERRGDGPAPCAVSPLLRCGPEPRNPPRYGATVRLVVGAELPP
jgi:hypothetical protein